MLQAAGLLFFAFAGYARIATLGEEVREPADHPRAIPIALALTLLVHGAGGHPHRGARYRRIGLGPSAFGGCGARRGALVRAGGPGRGGGGGTGFTAVADIGVSRTTLAMARDRHLPAPLAGGGAPAIRGAASGRGRGRRARRRAAAVADVRGVIGFSSFAVLGYYAVANASAWTLGRRLIPAVGLVGCGAGGGVAARLGGGRGGVAGGGCADLCGAAIAVAVPGAHRPRSG